MDIDVSKLPTSSKFRVDILYVIVFQTNSLGKEAFKGFAKSISSFDQKGQFDILPIHENFVTKFSNGLKIETEKGEKVAFDKKNGVIEVANNIVRVFIED